MSHSAVEPSVLHVVVGPDEHGVVRHGRLVAAACGGDLARLEAPGPVDAAGTDLVHVSYTDRLFGEHAEESVAAFRAMADAWTRSRSRVSVTLHDLPEGTSTLQRRRRAAYRDVAACATGVVVNSQLELRLAQQLDLRARSVRCIPLPVEHIADGARPDSLSTQVAVLGFLFPDRGYEHTIAELPTGVDLIALGRPSAGHEYLVETLTGLAAASGHRMTVTGFVPDADLAGELHRAGVPLAPNRRVSASGSINTWIAHGRRPLVPDSPYSRELHQRSPDCVTIYDADEPGSLRRAIEAALADPSRTVVPAGTAVGPTVEEVGRRYRRHFAGCGPARALPVDEHRWVVPGNRWDLLAGREPVEPPTVTVVIPHFEAQAQLDLVLTGLSRQSHPSTRLRVVVADDGSTAPPTLTTAPTLDAVVVAQARDGFRAAAARNLGAAASSGEVIAFLDGDTIPEPGYVSRACRLPALTTDAVTVGRRRHADLTGWTPRRLEQWLTGRGAAPDEFPEPAWLRDAYAASSDLLTTDHRTHRLLISAVLTLSSDLFRELGGFDERFHAYGGEDWELGHRAYVAGAVLAHVADAVAWHDGPDWAGRTTTTGPSDKNLETLTLTAFLPDPEARGGGQWRLPALAVELSFADPVAVLATSRAAFSGDTDCGIWVDHPDAEATVRVLADDRIRSGPVPRQVLDRCRAVLRLDAPARVTGLRSLMRRGEDWGRLSLPTGDLTPRRVARRATRWAPALGVDAQILEAVLFGGHDLPAPTASDPVDLAHELKHILQESTQDISDS